MTTIYQDSSLTISVSNPKISYTSKELANKIKDICCIAHGTTFEQINKVSRKREKVTVRHNIRYILRKYTSMTEKAVGLEFIYGTDHSTVIHSCKTWQDWIDTDKHLFAINNRIENEICELLHRQAN